MSDIQKQLQDLKKIRDIQDKVLVLRKELPTAYEGFLMKQTGILAEKLIQAEVRFEPPELYIPEIGEINMNILTNPRMNIDHIYENAHNIEKCLKYLSN